MENVLHIRDKVGLQDFLLLENFKDEESFIENLRKRFHENLIYVSAPLAGLRVLLLIEIGKSRKLY